MLKTKQTSQIKLTHLLLIFLFDFFLNALLLYGIVQHAWFSNVLLILINIGNIQLLLLQRYNLFLFRAFFNRNTWILCLNCLFPSTVRLFLLRVNWLLNDCCRLFVFLGHTFLGALGLRLFRRNILPHHSLRFDLCRPCDPCHSVTLRIVGVKHHLVEICVCCTFDVVLFKSRRNEKFFTESYLIRLKL